MKRSFDYLLIILLVFGLSRPSRASSDEEIRSVIENTLNIRHPSETGDWWRSLGVNTPNVIMTMFREEKSIYHQIRLLDALAWFDDSHVVDFLKDQAAHNSNDVARRAAIHSIGLSQGLKEEAFLRKSLESSDPHTRLVTAKLLNDLKDPLADRIVNDYLKTEKTEWVNSGVRARISRNEEKLRIEGKRR